eukprot:COSAG01_NODE_13266_length_1610_cov_1.538054_1_plen_129_part_10
MQNKTTSPFHPKNTIIWLIYAIFFIIGKLPLKFITLMGTCLGNICYSLLSKKRLLAKKNLELCFPNKDKIEINALCAKHFQCLGKGIINSSLSYTNPKRKLPLQVKGFEHIKNALKKGNGALLIYAHFT